MVLLVQRSPYSGQVWYVHLPVLAAQIYGPQPEGDSVSTFMEAERWRATTAAIRGEGSGVEVGFLSMFLLFN